MSFELDFKRVLPRPIFDFADGGAQDERTLRRNEQAFDGITLLPRPLNGAAERDLSVELFGRRISMPVIIGPTGLAGLFWPMGEQAAHGRSLGGYSLLSQPRLGDLGQHCLSKAVRE